MSVIYYKAYHRYWRTWNNIILGSSIIGPQGEETIREVSNQEFDKLIEEKKLIFEK